VLVHFLLILEQTVHYLVNRYRAQIGYLKYLVVLIVLMGILMHQQVLRHLELLAPILTQYLVLILVYMHLLSVLVVTVELDNMVLQQLQILQIYKRLVFNSICAVMVWVNLDLKRKMQMIHGQLDRKLLVRNMHLRMIQQH
jgi:hypothetical protein